MNYQARYLTGPKQHKAIWRKSVLSLLLAVIWLMGSWVCCPSSAVSAIPIHNSDNLSSAKWGVNGWGIAGGKYGEFTCSTCHGRNTGNIKRVNKVLAAPDADPFPIELVSGTVTFLDVRDGSSDFGDDSDAHTTSDRICEGCHSQNKFHNYDTSNNIPNGGDLNHENQKDCILCHKHANAFAASCTDCHGNPPSTNAHLIHAGSGAGEYTFTCSICHPVNHDGATTDITFTGIAASWGTETYSAAQMQCSSLYCHGSATADWDGGSGGACGDCHGDIDGRPDGTDEPAGGSHLTSSHLVACTNCHSHNGSDTTEHVNGDVGHTTGDALVSSAGTSVTSYVYGSTLASSPDPDGYKYSGGTCANSCHGDLDWGGTATCITCHNGSGSGATLITSSNSHTDADGAGLTYTSNDCDACHPAHTGGVLVDNNTAVGINYTADGRTGFRLGGTATSGTTEQEICNGCHAAIYQPWNVTQGSYTTGTLSNYSNWDSATWQSANFSSYKPTTIQSNHYSAAGQACSYCHDVHDTGGGVNDGAGPFLRGSWTSNPFPEDGAPQTTAHATAFGSVPRGGNGTLTTSITNAIGGWQIEQNNASFSWTDYATDASVCFSCHTGEAIRQAWPPHAAVVPGLGHTTSYTSANIYRQSIRGEGTNWQLGPMRHEGSALTGTPADDKKPTYVYGLRTPETDFTVGISPTIFEIRPLTSTLDLASDIGITVDDGTTDTGFHNFPCSKCHSPHMSALPRLMITNCLDVTHNAWDDSISPDGWEGHTSTQLGFATSALNCHRYVGASDTDKNQTGATEAGWNTVTPW